MRPSRLLPLAAVAACLALAACDGQPAAVAPDRAALSSAAADANRTLAEIRRATARFHRVEAAVEAGYVQASPCVAHPALGAMGFHYANFGLIDGTVDPSAPELLLYAPEKNGRLRLVAVEFMVAAAPWDAQHATPPALAGHVFEDHRAPEARHGIPIAHYDLHAWAWKHNPSGTFFPFNPTVSCG
ncbi:MAG: hypothetical protein AB1941_04080 [Gemmatimonadota bacterium]